MVHWAAVGCRICKPCFAVQDTNPNYIFSHLPMLANLSTKITNEGGKCTQRNKTRGINGEWILSDHLIVRSCLSPFQSAGQDGKGLRKRLQLRGGIWEAPFYLLPCFERGFFRGSHRALCKTRKSPEVISISADGQVGGSLLSGELVMTAFSKQFCLYMSHAHMLPHFSPPT